LGLSFVLEVCVVALRIQTNVFRSLLATQSLANVRIVATVGWLQLQEDIVLLRGPSGGRDVVWHVLILIICLGNLLDVPRSVHWHHALLDALLVLDSELLLRPFDSAHFAVGRRNDAGGFDIRLTGIGLALCLTHWRSIGDNVLNLLCILLGGLRTRAQNLLKAGQVI